MIKTIVVLFILYFLFLKIYETIKKLVENYKNKAQIHIFRVQIADTPNKREKGLMNITFSLYFFQIVIIFTGILMQTHLDLEC